jgi:hypothetical protein
MLDWIKSFFRKGERTVFIATDGVGTEIPDDVRDAAKRFAAEAAQAAGPDRGVTQSGPALGGTESGLGPSSAPAPAAGGGAVLDRWDIQAHQYRTEAEVKIGILGGLFSGRSKLVKSGVVQEAKRFYVTQTADNNRVEFGTAVRLLVATDGVDVEANLTIPNIAAGAQLSHFQARIAMSVIGFTGPLGAMLPAPGELNVETLPEYLEAFRKIQFHVFGKDAAGHLAPTLLGYSKLENS